MATSEALILVGTSLKLNGEVGADVAFSMENVSSGTGWVSAQHDFGAAPRDYLFYWHAELVFQASPTQYAAVNFYLAPASDADSTMVWGDVGTSDAALGDVDQVHNLIPIGTLIVEEADTSKMVTGGIIQIPYRYASIVMLNNAGVATNATDSNCIFLLQPFSLQGQAT